MRLSDRADFDRVVSQRQAGDHAVFLLKVQRNQPAVVLLSNALRLLDIQVELLFVVGGVHHQEGNEEHALVAALQVFQQLLGFAAIGGQIAGNDVHVISRSDRFLLFLDLHSVEIGDLALHVANGCNLINGLNMDGHDEAGFHGEEIGQAAVIQIETPRMEKKLTSPCLLPIPKVCLSRKSKLDGTMKSLVESPEGENCHFQSKRKGWVSMWNISCMSFNRSAIQWRREIAETLEVIQQINFNAFQPRLRGLEVLRFDAEGDELGFRQAVVALDQLVLQHLGIFVPHIVETVTFIGIRMLCSKASASAVRFRNESCK